MNTAFLSVTGKGEPHGNLPRIVCSGSWLPDMGFVTGALVQAIPEPDGMSFTLCDENIRRYSELSRSTDEQNGKLIQVIFSKNKKSYGEMIATSGHYIVSGGLSIGDSLIVHYKYGYIRMLKAHGMIGTVGSLNDKRAGKTISRIRLFGEWLADAGFVRDALAVAVSEPGSITLTLYDKGIEQYSALVKYVRDNGHKLLQFWQYYKSEKSSYVEIRGSCLESAGFTSGDLYDVYCEYGLIKLKKLELKDLGFS